VTLSPFPQTFVILPHPSYFTGAVSGHIDILFTGMLLVIHTLLVTSALGWFVSGGWVEKNKKFGRKGAVVSIMIPFICGTHFCGWSSNPVKIIKIVSFSKCPEGLRG
jgi:MFS family permease